MKILERQFETMLQVEERQWLEFVRESLLSYPLSPLFRLDDDAQLLKVRDWCDRARANGLEADDDVLGFVLLMHEFAPNFDQHPYLRAILDREEEPMTERWERLFDPRDEALERAWQEVERPGACSVSDWHVEEHDSIEEAFPASHRDPRFIQYFREVKARHADDPPPEGG